jgi:hypothetical protein
MTLCVRSIASHVGTTSEQSLATASHLGLYRLTKPMWNPRLSSSTADRGSRGCSVGSS